MTKDFTLNHDKSLQIFSCVITRQAKHIKDVERTVDNVYEVIRLVALFEKFSGQKGIAVVITINKDTM